MTSTNRSIMPLKTFQETLQYVVSLNHGVEWIPESWTNVPVDKVCQLLVLSWMIFFQISIIINIFDWSTQSHAIIIGLCLIPERVLEVVMVFVWILLGMIRFGKGRSWLVNAYPTRDGSYPNNL